jgi:hypothetical protein
MLNEAELVQYIRGLTERHLMPIKQMIKNFATPILGKEPSNNWVTHFLNQPQTYAYLSLDSPHGGRPPQG